MTLFCLNPYEVKAYRFIITYVVAFRIWISGQGCSTYLRPNKPNPQQLVRLSVRGHDNSSISEHISIIFFFPP